MHHDHTRQLPSINRVLAQLRRLLRICVAVYGLAICLLTVNVCVWISFLLDRTFDLPVPFRAIVTGSLAGLLIVACVRYILMPVFAPLADSQLALLLERHFPRLHQRLVTVVELSARKEELGPFGRQMLDECIRQAERLARKITVTKVVRFRPVISASCAAIFATGMAGWFFWHDQDAMRTWFRRSILLQDVAWPRQSRLFVPGFYNNVAYIGQGETFRLLVRADMQSESVPRSVRIWYRSPDSGWRSAYMVRSGQAQYGLQAYQDFTYEFQAVLNPIALWIKGGDCQIRNLTIQPVQSPLLVEVFLDCSYPAYTGRQKERIKLIGNVRIARGTELSLAGRADTALRRVIIKAGDTSVLIAPQLVTACDNLLEEERTIFETAVQDLTQQGWLDNQHRLSEKLKQLLQQLDSAIASDSIATTTGNIVPVKPAPERKALLLQAKQQLLSVQQYLEAVEESLGHQSSSAVERQSRRRGNLSSTAAAFVLPADHVNQHTQQQSWLVLLEQVLINLERAERQIAEALGFSQFMLPLGTLEEDLLLRITMTNTAGISTKKPVELGIAAKPDEPPQIAVQLEGIGTAITPNALLPLRGEIRDDWGVAQVSLKKSVLADGQVVQESQRQLATVPVGSESVEIDERLDLAGSGLQPGQKVQLQLSAQDHCTLEGGPNTSTGDLWQLDVVTAEELQAMLEARELVLRQRFEQIINEVQQTRRLLAELRDETENHANDASTDEATSEGSSDETSAEIISQAAARALRVERVNQNVQKNAHETEAILNGIQQIRMEFINNRLEDPNLLSRLQSKLIEPLTVAVNVEFPELRFRVEKLREEASQEDYHAAVQQADRLLQLLRSVLGHMMKLEDFTKLIQQLEQIIEAQENLRHDTQQYHAKMLEQLLELSP